MNSSIYRRLAVMNLKNNRKTYVPYMFTAVLTVIMYFVIDGLVRNGSVGDGTLRQVLSIARVVVIIFAVIFLFYTNSFLIKRRKKEIGMYNILGMGKGHIARMLTIETIIISVVSIAAGLVLGVLFSRLIWLLLLHIIHYDVLMEFEVRAETFVYAAVLFAVIFAATLVYNLLQIRHADPAQILHGAVQGEREPQTKWLLALFGVLAVGSGYFIALTTETPLEAVENFCVAVVAVILGTYALFTAGSIAFLKRLKRNQRFYYQSRHFTAVSGMIYRMKQNAVGLANICILSTIVLVLVSVSISLYAGKEEILHVRYPEEVSLGSYGTSEELQERVKQAALEEARKNKVKIVNEKHTIYGACAALEEEGKFALSTAGNYSNDGIREMYLIPQENYNEIEKDNISLKNDEVIVYTTDKDGYGKDTIQIEDKTYHVVKELEHLWTEEKSQSRVLKGIYLIFDGTDEIEKWLQYVYDTSNMEEDWKQLMCQMRYKLSFDLEGEEEDRIKMEEDLLEKVMQDELPGIVYDGREISRKFFYMQYGGLFFIGLYLGILFLMATVLIIYYKQISEGYDDRERYQIMQKVGMDKQEVRRSIKSQVLMVFFIPLAVAVVHVSVAFPVVQKLLGALGFVNVPLFLGCTAVTVGAFAVFYAAVYGVTAREYYRIVK